MHTSQYVYHLYIYTIYTLYIYICPHIQIYIYICIHLYIHTHIYIYIHIYILSHTPLHTQHADRCALSRDRGHRYWSDRQQLIYIYTHTHINIYINIHNIYNIHALSHTHTYIHSRTPTQCDGCGGVPQGRGHRRGSDQQVLLERHRRGRHDTRGQHGLRHDRRALQQKDGSGYPIRWEILRFVFTDVYINKKTNLRNSQIHMRGCFVIFEPFTKKTGLCIRFRDTFSNSYVHIFVYIKEKMTLRNSQFHIYITLFYVNKKIVRRTWFGERWEIFRYYMHFLHIYLGPFYNDIHGLQIEEKISYM